MTNNTKLSKITNQLGHGVRYDLFEELENKNAYRTIGLQENGLALPESCIENTFSILVAHNIDLKEEMVSGECS